MKAAFALLAAISWCSTACAETIDVKYRGPVNLKPFVCQDFTRSSFVKRVCFDTDKSYMIIKLNGTYYHFCSIDAGTVDALNTADSMGRFFNANIKGKFDCRLNPVPDY